jgi:hypothetical protein
MNMSTLQIFGFLRNPQLDQEVRAFYKYCNSCFFARDYGYSLIKVHRKKMLAIFRPQPGCHLPKSPWAEIIKLFPENRKPFLQCIYLLCRPGHSMHIKKSSVYPVTCLIREKSCLKKYRKFAGSAPWAIPHNLEEKAGPAVHTWEMVGGG